MAKKTSKKKSGAPRAPTKRHNAFSRPAVKKGEVYVGAIVNAAGKGHHVILLAGDESGTWQALMDSAKARGGDLPDRVEQALLFRDHKDQFQKDWYWSNTQYAGDEDSAWCQGFDDGNQLNGLKGGTCRARAVRRLAIK